MLIFVPLWQFFFCVTLCNLTNCLFGHKISLPVQVWLDRFHCIHYYRMQIFIQNMTLLLYSDIHISVSAYHIFKFSRHVHFIKKKSNYRYIPFWKQYTPTSFWWLRHVGVVTLPQPSLSQSRSDFSTPVHHTLESATSPVPGATLKNTAIYILTHSIVNLNTQYNANSSILLQRCYLHSFSLPTFMDLWKKSKLS